MTLKIKSKLTYHTKILILFKSCWLISFLVGYGDSYRRRGVAVQEVEKTSENITLKNCAFFYKLLNKNK